MQLAKINSGLTISNGITDSTNFRIEADGKMFRLLSDTLYQNKIGSMVREVSCNAVDAHIAANTPDEPFIIHAPCQLEPWFSVKDNGIGLSHQEVIDIFTCFGKSTKSSSNTMVGAFGFGSKTPFAYTNTFTVTSIKDGVKNSYAAVIGEDNLPTMNLMDSVETDEHNGLEVTVAVEPRDFNEFYDEISSQLRFFKVKPIIKGSTRVVFSDPLCKVIEKISEHTMFRSDGDVEVVQGGVAYPVDLEQLNKGLDKHVNSSLLAGFINSVVYNYNPVMFFEIGQIAVTPSRESISYDAPTIKNILDRLDEVRQVLCAKIEAKIDAMPSIWEKTIALREHRYFYSRLFKYKDNKWGVATDDGDVYIRLPFEINEVIDYGDKRVRHLMPRYYRNTSAIGFRVSMESNWNIDKIHPTANSVIVVDDGAGAPASRIRRYIEETSNSVYFFRAEESEVTGRFTKKDHNGKDEEHCTYASYVNSEIDPIILSKLCDAVDGATIIMLSDLPKTERVQVIKQSDGTTVTKERPKYTPAKAYKFVGSDVYGLSYFKAYEKTFVAPKKMTEPAAYVAVDGRRIQLLGIPHNNLLLIIQAIKSGDFTMPIYALREKDIEKIKDNPLWKPLGEVANELRSTLEQKYKGQFSRPMIALNGDNYIDIVCTKVMQYLQINHANIHDPLLRKVIKSKNRANKWRNMSVNSLAPLYENIFYGNIQNIYARINKRNGEYLKELNRRYEVFSLSSYNWSDAMLEDFLDLLNIRYQKYLATQRNS